jgi:DNA polymerase I-like protein with 3'-5' exonuclease and polymerase domains
MGIRECFVPRAGKVFAQADFSGLELHTLAQVCVTKFGKSHLAEALNAGLDPHTAVAADILGISYEEAVRRQKAGDDEEFDNARQTGKVLNFGLPGGLGAEKLCLFARKSYGVLLTEERARELKAQWLERWPETKLFFQHVSDLMDEDTGEGQVNQLFSQRIRSGCHYTAAANTYFQGLGADAAKRAHYLVVRACYAEPASVLYGSRPVNFVHDETICEVDDDEFAHDKAIELGRLMLLGANEFLPDVPARVEPLLARCWSKKSKPVYKSGRLVPWAA